MLQNLILDMGNVMIEYAPERILDRKGITDRSLRELLRREIYQSVEWALLDWGALDEAGAAERICARLPESLHDTVRDLVFHWDLPLVPVAGMAELVHDAKAAGLGIYLLSNASVRLPEYWPRVAGHELFDGVAVSALIKAVKPMPEAYRHVLDTYGLTASSCLFVDDVPMNVAGAIRQGIAGFVFRGDVAALREEIIRLGGKL